jgi:hypothetical protein
MHFVMAGLVPTIRVFDRKAFKTWMPATSAGMTNPNLLLLSASAKADDPVHTGRSMWQQRA